MKPMRLDRPSITCLIADDHPPIVDAVRRYLVDAGFTVVATAQNGEQALAKIEAHAPLVCVADVRMPRLDGFDLARRAARVSRETKILLYSGFSDRGLVSDAFDAGACGFALKDAPLEDLTRAIELVANGAVYIDPVLAASLVRTEEQQAAGLSGREREVLRLLAEGDSYTEIGSTLFLSPDTVRVHAYRAMAKLGARTRTQAVALALRQALIA